jgi:osomolarity two-component system response regulator SKN7
MNDILAKPFTKNGLFGILDKHLIHLKAIQLSGEVPRSVGVPPLSAEGFMDAMITSANMQLSWTNGNVTGNADDGDGEGQLVDLRNPLGGMGMSDDAYQILLHVSALIRNCGLFDRRIITMIGGQVQDHWRARRETVCKVSMR